jgi:hypothetical protein
MNLKIHSYPLIFQVNVTALHSFALALRAQYGVLALGKENDHCQRAGPCLASLVLSANSVFNRGFQGSVHV